MFCIVADTHLYRTMMHLKCARLKRIASKLLLQQLPIAHLGANLWLDVQMYVDTCNHRLLRWTRRGECCGVCCGAVTDLPRLKMQNAGGTVALETTSRGCESMHML
jgi:hypothetical protein